MTVFARAGQREYDEMWGEVKECVIYVILNLHIIVMM